MIELVGEMIFFLVGAIILGFLIGWFFGKALNFEDCDIDYDELCVREDEHVSQIKSLEEKYEKEKEKFEECNNKNRDLKSELMKKINLLKIKSNTLEEIQQKHGDNTEERIVKLESVLKQKNREILEFERVLVKAEKTIERLKSEKDK